MNLHAVIASAINAVSPPMVGNVMVSTGSSQNADFSRTPTYTTTTGVTMQVQPLTSRQLQHMDALNIQGVFRSVWLNGTLNGVVRAAGNGGDILMLPTGYSSGSLDTWLVVEQVEAWDTDGWVHVIVQLQNNPPAQDQ
jgi:hypothetical protein